MKLSVSPLTPRRRLCAGQDSMDTSKYVFHTKKSKMPFFIKLLCISFMGDIFTQRGPVLSQTLAGHELSIMHTKSEKL